jgi:GNAT superfamily N-acetyltransferase
MQKIGSGRKFQLAAHRVHNAMKWLRRKKQLTPGTADRIIHSKSGQEFWITIDSEDDPYEMQVWCSDQLVGLLSADWEDKEVELMDIFIFPPYLNQGLGTALLQEFIALARRKSMQRIHGYVPQQFLTETPHLLKWYQKQGFSVLPPPPKALAAALLELNLAESHADQ